MQDFRQLKVWEYSHQLVIHVYNHTAGFPKSELYGLTGQIRRAAVSVPANIAEGCCRGSDQDFARFLQVAVGSVSELDYLLLLSRELQFLSTEVHSSLIAELDRIRQMLINLIQKLHG